MIRIVTGAHAPDSGSLEIAGRSVTRADPLLARSLGVAPIYQQPALFPDLSVAENLAFGRETGGAWRRVSWPARRKRALELLGRVGARIDPDAPARSLRMAEQQLVEIARALGANASILLMDEPTAALAAAEAERLFDLIGDLRGQGKGIVYVSHRLPEVLRLADRVSVLRDGALVETRPAKGLTELDLIRLMVGRELSTVFPKRNLARGNTVLEARRVSCRASGVRDATFDLRAGEILGLAGLVGSGRTELARVLFGLTPKDAGEIRLRGETISIDSPAQAIARGLGYVPEDRRRHGVIPELSVAANTTLAVLPKLGSPLLDDARERALAEGFVARFAIKTPSIDTPVAHLSGGNQQKVALARWLATEPKLLILDEPTQGVDVGAKAEIHRWMAELAEKGLAILMISSELPEILGMSDRIAVMHGGTIVATVDREGATQESILALALGGGTAAAEAHH